MHATNLYIYTPRYDYRGIFVNSGAKNMQRQDASNQNCLLVWTPTYVDCTKCNCYSNHCGHPWFELHENDENIQCASYANHRHICACPKVYNVCISFPSEALKHTFEKYASEHHQTMKYGMCDLLGLCKCASSQRITQCSDCCYFCHNLRFNNH